MSQFADEFTATINGSPVASHAKLKVIDPASGTVIGEAPDCGEEQLDAAVGAARAAFAAWRATKLSERQAAVKALGACIAAHKDSLMRLLTAEQGKPHADALSDVMGGVQWCDNFAAMDLPVLVTEDGPARRVEVRRTPIGVVGALAPWNFPVILAMLKVAPALVAGNTVILKPSPFTPLTTLRIGELSRGILPPGVLNVISGGDRLGPWMTAHPGIDKISFTGSTATGRRVMGSAADTLKRITLELGGNDASIVLPDVDIDMVAKQVFYGAFGNSGQICAAIKRLYVHEAIYDRFAQALVRLVQSAKVGNGAEPGVKFGPMQNKAQFDRVVALIEESKAAGYRFLAGGEVVEGAGYFLPLSIVDNPPDDSRIVREEQFGPVLPMMKFADLNEAVRRANDTPYGLGAQVWAGDPQTAAEIGARLEAGSVWINQAQAIYGHSPFGGHKASGIGVESSLEGLLAYTNAQTIVMSKKRVAA
jgi:aldehyde dehydrogenase (NAD+)